MTFSQYEREVISERTRDKLRASRQKGLYTGGIVVLGYRAEDKKQLIIPEEARLVRRIFQRYIAIQSPKVPGCDSPLLLNLARGFHWHSLINDGTYANIKALAEAIGIDSGVVAKATRLTLLSPTIVHKLILGEADLSMQTLRRSFPLVWEKQERELLR